MTRRWASRQYQTSAGRVSRLKKMRGRGKQLRSRNQCRCVSVSAMSSSSSPYSSSSREGGNMEKRRRRSPDGCIIRRARRGDVEKVAVLCGDAFHPDEAVPSDTADAPMQWLRRQFNAYRNQQLRRAVHSALTAALRRKARAEALRRRAARFQLFSAQSVTSTASQRRRSMVSAAARDEERESRREREHFHVLVCENLATGAIVGAVFVFLYRAAAETPPPMPTTAPLVMYISNVSVLPEFRGQGCATRLMDEAERLTRRWGYEFISLHVKPDNQAAYTMYLRRGYARVGSKRWWNGDELLRKRLAPRMKETPRLLANAVTPTPEENQFEINGMEQQLNEKDAEIATLKQQLCDTRNERNDGTSDTQM